MLRLALKNLWARKGRLLMSAVGVIASCAFLAGVFVFGDTIKGSFNRMFASAYRNTSVVVRSSNVIKADFGSDTRDTVDTALVDQLAATPGVKIKMIDHADAVEAMNKKYGPLYAKDVITKDIYPGMAGDNQIASVWNLLVVNESMPEKVAYDIVKLMFDKKPDLIAVHAEAKNFDLKYQRNENTPVSFHPGAIKFFAEKGITVK